MDEYVGLQIRGLQGAPSPRYYPNYASLGSEYRADRRSSVELFRQYMRVLMQDGYDLSELEVLVLVNRWAGHPEVSIFHASHLRKCGVFHAASQPAAVLEIDNMFGSIHDTQPIYHGSLEDGAPFIERVLVLHLQA